MKNHFIACLALLFLGVVAKSEEEAAVVEPHSVVEHYSFSMNKFRSDPARAKVFTFQWTKDGYSVKVNATGKWLVQDVHYIKTFGGRPPTARFELINNRFLVIPRTIKNSAVLDTTFHEMMAVTEVYDLQTGKKINESKPYQYDHDVYLMYSLDAIQMHIYTENREQERQAEKKKN